MKFRLTNKPNRTLRKWNLYRVWASYDVGFLIKATSERSACDVFNAGNIWSKGVFHSSLVPSEILIDYMIDVVGASSMKIMPDELLMLKTGISIIAKYDGVRGMWREWSLYK